MLSILTQDAPTRDLEALNDAIQAEVLVAPEKQEFEIVLGRLQVASVLFVGIVILVVFSAGSYLAGKASAPRAVVAAQETPVPVPTPAPIIQATIVRPPETPKKEAPVFNDPVIGATYLQMGAVDEGIAMLLVEGLRKRGFQSFAATGPNDKIFRVLIGPLPNADAYNEARDAISKIGVITFVRKYQP
jgi:cell division septation protein DedD